MSTALRLLTLPVELPLLAEQQLKGDYVMEKPFAVPSGLMVTFSESDKVGERSKHLVDGFVPRMLGVQAIVGSPPTTAQVPEGSLYLGEGR